MMPNTTEGELAALLLLLARSANLTPQCPLATFANNLLTTVECEPVHNEDIKETLANQFTSLVEKQKALESQIEVFSIARDKLQGELSRVESHLQNLCNDLNNIVIQRDMCKLGINALLLEAGMVQYTNAIGKEGANTKKILHDNSSETLEEVAETINTCNSPTPGTQKELVHLNNSGNGTNEALRENLNYRVPSNDLEDREALLLTSSGMQDENTSEIESSLQSSWSSILSEMKMDERKLHGTVNINGNDDNDTGNQNVKKLTSLHQEGTTIVTNTHEQCRKDYKEHNEVKWTTRRQTKQSALAGCDDEKKVSTSKDNNNNNSNDNNNNKSLECDAIIENNNLVNDSSNQNMFTALEENVELTVCCVDDKENSLAQKFTNKKSEERTPQHATSDEEGREAKYPYIKSANNKALQETNAIQERKELEHHELQKHNKSVSSDENSYGDKVYSNLLFALKTSGISEVALVQALTSFEQWAFAEYSRWADGCNTNKEESDERHVCKHNSTAQLKEKIVYQSKIVEVLETIAHHLLRMQPNIQLMELRIVKHVFTASPINDAKTCEHIARILTDLIRERYIIIVLTQLLNSINDDVKSAALECLLPFVCLSHSVLRVTMSSWVCASAREIFVEYDGLKYLLHIVEFNTSVTVLYRALIFLWGLLSKDDERKLTRQVAQTSNDKINIHEVNNQRHNTAEETMAMRKSKEVPIEDVSEKKQSSVTLSKDTSAGEFDVIKTHNRRSPHDSCNSNNVEYNNCTECVNEVHERKRSIATNGYKNEKSLNNSSTIISNTTSSGSCSSCIYRIIRELGGLQAVIPLLYTDTLVLLENVCMVIGYMTRDEENKAEMRECGGLEKLTATLHHPSLSIKAKIAGAIWNCSSNATNRTHLRHIGTISSLLQLLEVNRVEFKNVYKLKDISTISVNGNANADKQNANNVHEGNSSNGINNNSNDESQTCSKTIGASKNNGHTNDNTKSDNSKTIGNDKTASIALATNAVTTTGDKNACTLDDANNNYKSNSAYPSTNKNNTDVVIHSRESESDQKKVRSTTEEREEIEFVRENATGALWNISLDVENKLSIVKYGGLVDLLALLTESTKLTVIENASGTLWNCSALYEARRIIDECDGVFIMLAYLYKYMLRHNLQEYDSDRHFSENNVNTMGKKYLGSSLNAHYLETETRDENDNSAKALDCNQHRFEQQLQQQQKQHSYHDITADNMIDSNNKTIVTFKSTANIFEPEHSTTERWLTNKFTCFWENDAPMPCNCKIAENVLGILRNCAVIDTNKSALLKYNSIPIMIECLRIWAYNVVMHNRASLFLSDNAIERVTSILWILSISAESKHEIRRCGGLELLIAILMMSSSTEHGTTNSSVNKSIATNESHEITCDSAVCDTKEAMQPSITRKQWQEILYCSSSNNAVNNKNYSNNLTKFIARLKAISSAEPAISLNMSIREKIVGVLRNCSTLQENKESLLKCHIIKCLVAVVLDCYSPWTLFTSNETSQGKCSKLDFPSAQLKETVASAIWHLAKENKDVVRAEGGLELMCLFVAMPQQTTLILEQATGALSSLTMNNMQNRISLKEYDTFKSLMQRVVEYTLQQDELESQEKQTKPFTTNKVHNSENNANDSMESDSSATAKKCVNYIVANSIVTLRNCMINNSVNVKECGKLSLQNNCAFLHALLELIKSESAELTKELLLLLRYLCSIREVSQHVAQLQGSSIVSSINLSKLSETARRAVQYILENLKRTNN